MSGTGKLAKTDMLEAVESSEMMLKKGRKSHLSAKTAR